MSIQKYMQRTKTYLVASMLMICCAWIITSCDKISEPFMEKPDTTDTLSKVRKILLEDFTGHRCVNCPQAHEIIKQLEQLYGEKLVTVGIHAGVFAIPVSAPYNYDFRTTAGNSLETTFGVISYPIGMVNRKKFSGSLLTDKDAWGSAVASLISEPAEAYISLTNTYNSSSRSLSVTVETEILSSLNGIYRLCVYLTEDNIEKPQKNNDSSIGTTPDIMDYVHSHVLRGSVNSTWGDTLATNPFQGQVISKTYSNFVLDTDWDETNCKVVAFIYRDDDADGSRYEVVQAEKKKVI